VSVLQASFFNYRKLRQNAAVTNKNRFVVFARTGIEKKKKLEKQRKREKLIENG